MKHKSYIDFQAYRIKEAGNYVRFNGWYLDDSGQSAQFSAEINGRPGALELQRRGRPDAARR